MSQINWYPGHMARSRRLLEEQLRAVNVVIELCDARAPAATRNPDLVRLSRGKTRILVLNKADLADDAQTARWLAYYRAQGITALRFNANGGKTKDILARIDEATRPAAERYAARGVRKTLRAMILGIPNVGKSTFVNRLYGGNIAATADRPGVTRANRWIKLGPYLEILDTPGMLPPKLDDQNGAKTLAFLGSIRDQIIDTEALAGELLQRLLQINPTTAQRFKLDPTENTEPWELLEAACKGRGWLLSGGRYDLERGAALVLDEFRAGKVGKITLEPCPNSPREARQNANEQA
ncbi:MAG: ribosome biogenesis GTPase YlqF [Clostridia bacterium]|nr:ribosome biogenesis GTPase YlqF [Clostridia bacterium]